MGRPNRRGIALFLSLLLALTAGAIAIAATYLGGTTTLVTKQYERESDFKYAADWALQYGKSALMRRPALAPDSGYVTLFSDRAITKADGSTLANTTVSLYAAKSGNRTGQVGAFRRLIAVASDRTGARIIRRLELSAENIGKFSFFVDLWPANLKFGAGTVLYGTVWANEQIIIVGNSSTFFDTISTAGLITGAAGNTFKRGYQESQTPIPMPTAASFAAVPGAATTSGLNFTAPTSGLSATTLMRVEFLSADMRSPADADSLDDGEGFVRVYQGNAGTATWVRGEYLTDNCGDWHASRAGGPLVFFPHSMHGTAWFKTILTSFNGMSAGQANTHGNLTLNNLMTGAANPRCYMGGDPHLAAVERNGNAGYTVARQQIGGEDSTFTPVGVKGKWIASTKTPTAMMTTRRPWDALYLTGLSTLTNPTFVGAMYVNGSALVSGTVNGHITLWVTGELGEAGNIRYANDPSLGNCHDLFGPVSSGNLVAINNTQTSLTKISGATFLPLGPTSDFYLHAIAVSLTGSQVDEAPGANNTTVCNGNPSNRGCMYVSGGLIAKTAGAMGAQASGGFTPQRSFDRCLLTNTSPYFPSTGRLTDNRFVEIDPVGFNLTTYINSIRP